MINYKDKYLKYKNKYKILKGGAPIDDYFKNNNTNEIKKL